MLLSSLVWSKIEWSDLVSENSLLFEQCFVRLCKPNMTSYNIRFLYKKKRYNRYPCIHIYKFFSLNIIQNANALPQLWLYCTRLAGTRYLRQQQHRYDWVKKKWWNEIMKKRGWYMNRNVLIIDDNCVENPLTNFIHDTHKLNTTIQFIFE